MNTRPPRSEKGRRIQGDPTAQPAPPRQTFGWPDVLIGIGLVAIGWAVLGGARAFPFVNYDDPTYVSDNIHVLGGVSWSAIKWAFSSVYAGYWSPLLWLSYMGDASVGGSAGAFHLTNIAFHLANTCLLFAFLRDATNARWASAFVAAVFAVHPLHVESVVWVTERKDVLSGFFWMLALLTYVRYTRRPSTTAAALVVLWFACGLMSKPMVVTLPIVLLLLDLWPLGRLSGGGQLYSRIKTLQVD